MRWIAADSGQPLGELALEVARGYLRETSLDATEIVRGSRNMGPRGDECTMWSFDARLKAAGADWGLVRHEFVEIPGDGGRCVVAFRVPELARDQTARPGTAEALDYLAASIVVDREKDR